mmetsp:Transcript_12606/g.37927  ORF Transcript_12606/g.37927 Transcript_12606/m.37927 type:complete len:344 (+) Transcript_12606:4298-5329(+)
MSPRVPIAINSTFSGPGGALLLSDVMSTRAVALSTPTAAQMFPTSQRLQRGMQLPPVRKHLGSVGGPKCRGDHLIGKSVHVGRNRRAAVWNLSSGQTTRDPAQLRSPPHEYEMRPLFAAVNSQPFPTLPPSRPPLNRARSRCIAGGLAVASAAATASVSKPKDQVMTPRHSSLDSDLDLSRDSGSDASASSAASMPAIAGSWRKDKQASDMEGYGRALDLLGIGGMKKKAATILMDGIDIEQDDEGFKTTFVTKVRFFRPVESFSYSSPKQMSRRDQRKGCQTAVVSPTGDGGLEVDVTWSEPLQGGFKETYKLQSPDELHIKSVTTIGDRSESTLQIYRKAD